MPSPASLFLGILFGSIGVGYFIYGKREQMFVPLLAGILLIALPWFVASMAWLVLAGLAVMAVPYFVRY
jgi:hypothetical protein